MRSLLIALMLLVGLALPNILVTATGSTNLFNDTGSEVYGLRVLFDQPVTIVRMGEAFTNWTSEGDGTTIVFSDGEIAVWGDFYFFYEPENAQLVSHQWLLLPPEPSESSSEFPFVHKEEGTLFFEDFEDGRAEGWALEEGWSVAIEGDNHILSGRGHHWADPRGRGWTDYVAEVRFKLKAGRFHFNFRYSQVPGAWGDRYFLGIHRGGLDLNKQIDHDFFHLTSASINIASNKWYQVKVSLNGANIKVYLDGKLKIDYTDGDLPLRSGGIAFETLDDSYALFDDIIVSGIKLVQRSNWVKTGGPRGGLGYDVRIHPINHSIMFVTDNPSGVNKSYDGGNTWVQRNKGITSRTGGSMDGVPIFCLTIDPNNPNIVWAGTQGMRGIYKSTDGGETWVKKDNGVAEWHEITFRGFAICPGDSDIVFAGAEISTGIQGFEHEKVKGKIYKTKNGGENWRCVWEGDNLVRFILIDPTNPDVMYASTGIFDREAYNDVGVGVLKSTDGGQTWRQINNGLTNLFVGFLEMHPTNPQILFAAAGNATAENRGQHGGVYRTTDGGETWTQVLAEDIFPQVFTVVTLSPSNLDVVYAGSEWAFYRSDDRGDTWQKFTKPQEFWGPPGGKVGPPISAVVDPNDPYTVFTNNYTGGAFKSTDGGKTWINSSDGYTGADLHDIAIDPDNPATVYTIGRSGPFRSFDGGRHWTGIYFSPMSEPEWYAVALNPDNPQEVIASEEFWGLIFKSADRGNSWRIVFDHPNIDRSINDPSNRHGFKTIAYAPSSPDILYAGMIKRGLIPDSVGEGSSFGIYKSTDGGKTWIEKNTGLENSSKNINAIVVHPSNPNIAYAATVRDGIYKTTDGGESWAPINNGLMSLDVRSLAIGPKNPEIVYAGLGEGAGIFKTTNGGELWEGINYGVRVECPSYLQRVGQVMPGVSLVKPKRLIGADYYSLPWTSIRSIVIDPVDTQILYAADFYLGVYMSTDGGKSWTTINEGLSTKAVSALALSADGRILYAATSGEGVFRLELW